MGVGDVGVVVQIPGIARPESVHTEQVDEGIKVGLRPKCRIRFYRGSVMVRTEPTAVARNHRRPVQLAYRFGVSAPEYRREACPDVRIEIGDRLVEVGQVEAVIVPLSVWILVGWIEPAVDEQEQIRQREGLRYIRDRDKH